MRSILAKHNLISNLRRGVIIVLLFILSSTPLVLINGYSKEIANLGWGSYGGLFILTLLNSSGTLTAGFPLPIPGLAITFFAGNILNPLLVGLVAGLGSGLGECFSYPIGLAGRVLYSSNRTVHKLQSLIHRYGSIIIFIGAVLPNPLFDFVGLSAGLSGYSFGKFFKFVMLGRIIRAFVTSYLGSLLSNSIILPDFSH